MNWLLIRGLGRHAEHWHDFIEKLEKSENTSKVVCLDLPGSGKEVMSSMPFTLNGVIEKLRKKFLSFKKEENWNILGISLGGMIALKWVDLYPQDFKNISIINSSLPFVSSIDQRISPTAMMTLTKLMFDSSSTWNREKRILELTLNLREVTGEMVRKWCEIDELYPLKRDTVIKQLLAAASFKRPKKLNIPLTVLCARNDRFTSWKCSERIADLYKGRLEVHPTAGHDLPLDDGKWVIEKISSLKE